MEEKILFENVMAERIIKLQKEKKLTNRAVVKGTDVSYDVLRNIKTGKNKTIPYKYLKDLARKFECTVDYLINKSDSPSLTYEGKEISHPISFDERDKKLEEINKYLYKDPQTLESLHLLLFRLPDPIRNNMLSAFHAVCENTRIMTLADRKDELTASKFNLINNVLLSDNTELTKMTIKLAEADTHLSKKRYPKALLLYLEIIYYANIPTRKVVKMALSSVEVLQGNWKNFPEELKPLKDYSTQILESPYCELPPKAESIIAQYLKPNKDHFIDRKTYLESLIQY